MKKFQQKILSKMKLKQQILQELKQAWNPGESWQQHQPWDRFRDQQQHLHLDQPRGHQRHALLTRGPVQTALLHSHLQHSLARPGVIKRMEQMQPRDLLWRRHLENKLYDSLLPLQMLLHQQIFDHGHIYKMVFARTRYTLTIQKLEIFKCNLNLARL
jgi:hypothetical protein